MEKAEFRILLQFLRQYLEYFQAFDVLDSDHDKRLSWNEFNLAVPLLEKWTGPIKDTDLVFKEMDKDKQGMVLFDEFCRWSSDHNLDLHLDEEGVTQDHEDKDNEEQTD